MTPFLFLLGAGLSRLLYIRTLSCSLKEASRKRKAMTWWQSSTPHSAYLLIASYIVTVCLVLPISYQTLPISYQKSIANPGCQDKCGGIDIPYPFGIGNSSCFNNTWYELTCQTHETHHPKLILTRLGLEVFNISQEFLSLSVGLMPHETCTTQSVQKYRSLNLSGTPYKFSASSNVFVLQGCNGTSFLRNETQDIIARCSTGCNNGNITDHYRPGVNFCQSQVTSWIPVAYILEAEGYNWRPEHPRLDYYEVDLSSNLPAGKSQGGCLVATLMDTRSVNHFIGHLSSSHRAPVNLMSNFLPSDIYINPLVKCEDAIGCKCRSGYIGNPYMTNGCKELVLCRGCRGYCSQNVAGEFHCYHPLSREAILGLSIGPGLVLLTVCLYCLYRVVKRKRNIKRRENNFKRNGGLLLQQQLSSKGALGRTKVFTTSELEKASDNFNKDRILGQGGQGTVYKGMLTDGKIVAIKKSKLVDESQIGQFINEMVILSQINHRNVVKLLGCCLETEVPLLVYEFIPNGTLFQHIHEPDHEDTPLSWEMRLKVAYESACAIAYLHSSSSPPIYHRDIKTSNILLDEKNIAKVSDFGSSKTIALDQTHLTTVVQGTMGYLDPEYFQSYQFTEKSDVYSFGVVLLELLTNKKPFYRGELLEQKNLVTEFLYMMENSFVIEFFDLQIVKEVKKEVLVVVGRLVKRCLSSSGRLRPKMKEVAVVLEKIIESPTQIEPNLVESLPEEDFIESYDTTPVDQLPREQLTWSNSYQGRVSSSFSVEAGPLLFNTR